MSLFLLPSPTRPGSDSISARFRPWLAWVRSCAEHGWATVAPQVLRRAKAIPGTVHLYTLFVASLVALPTALAQTSSAPGKSSSSRKPNIIVFLNDDLGWGDLGAFGHSVIKTPGLDRLAREGCELRDFYVCTPVCASSRAGIMTGRAPERFGLGFLMNATSTSWPIYHHVPLAEPSIARLLKSGGYRTCHLGKWHLSLMHYPGEPTPVDWGFDHYLTKDGPGQTTGSLYRNLTNWTRDGNLIQPGELPEWAADAYVDETIRFIEQSGNQPFFINLWTFAPHEDLECAQRYKDMYADRTPQEQLYFGTVTQMDEAYARILAYLDQKGLGDNTIIIFTSDNGPETYVTPNLRQCRGSSGPWRGGKQSVYEGGIRVPAIVRWPGLTRPGSVSDEPMTTLDLLPTLCAAAGVKLPDAQLDGVDIQPVLGGQPFKRGRPLFWQYMIADHLKSHNPVLGSPPLALRDGHWKLLCYPDLKTQVELYNLDIDWGEKWNVATTYPEITARMLKQIQENYIERNKNVTPASAYLNPNIPLPPGPPGSRKI
jgi:arylsulfatase A